MLLDGPTPFAALYASFRKVCPNVQVSVDGMLNGVNELERAGLVSVRQMNDDGSLREPHEADRLGWGAKYSNWLPNATIEDASLDEVGLWIKITEQGQVAWKRWDSTEDGGE